jgi:hypothetical protein
MTEPLALDWLLQVRNVPIWCLDTDRPIFGHLSDIIYIYDIYTASRQLII